MAEITEIRLPRLADAVSSVRFGAWLKQAGDRVEAGEPIAEVETDKTTVELDAPAAGVLCDLRVEPGADDLEVGAVLARIAPAAAAAGPPAPPSADDGARPGPVDESASSRDGPRPRAADRGATGDSAIDAPAERDEAPDARSGARAEGVRSDTHAGREVAPAAVGGRPAAADGAKSRGQPSAPPADTRAVSDDASAGAPAEDARAATPLARRMAAAADIDLFAIRPAGPDDRIRKADIDRVLAARRGASRETPTASAPATVFGGGAPAGDVTTPPAPGTLVGDVALAGDVAPLGEAGQPPAPTSGGPAPVRDPPALAAEEASGGAAPSYREERVTAMRRVTATRMQQAKQTVPHFYLRTDCRVDAALQFLAAAKRHYPAAPTLTDLVVRAAASALRAVPEANAAWADGAVRVYERVDIAVAVATPQGLVAPVVRGADGKDLGAIAGETRAMAARAREGRLAPDEYSGGTFTVSNLGMYGVESLYAIVNPPQSGILGVGAASRRPVADGDAVGVGTVMACTLSADHRVIDGAAGAELLAAIRSRLEQPALMLLETGAPPAPVRDGSP